ncbi:unnamed protein product [Ceratitis capitata]|uniref:(Mediterranean fruit fly) hypothetical protein n=1 Tax=Ceratitis capitata TaxID=7213 RepID=A0A811VE66_CERCA|nr:unnamed protein product [Ceratitis capitata]
MSSFINPAISSVSVGDMKKISLPTSDLNSKPSLTYNKHLTSAEVIYGRHDIRESSCNGPKLTYETKNSQYHRSSDDEWPCYISSTNRSSHYKHFYFLQRQFIYLGWPLMVALVARKRACVRPSRRMRNS